MSRSSASRESGSGATHESTVTPPPVTYRPGVAGTRGAPRLREHASGLRERASGGPSALRFADADAAGDMRRVYVAELQ